jgi:hypothetical protein
MTNSPNFLILSKTLSHIRVTFREMRARYLEWEGVRLVRVKCLDDWSMNLCDVIVRGGKSERLNCEYAIRKSMICSRSRKIVNELEYTHPELIMVPMSLFGSRHGSLKKSSGVIAIRWKSDFLIGEYPLSHLPFCVALWIFWIDFNT